MGGPSHKNDARGLQGIITVSIIGLPGQMPEMASQKDVRSLASLSAYQTYLRQFHESY